MHAHSSSFLPASRDQQRLHRLLQLSPAFALAFNIGGMARVRLPLERAAVDAAVRCIVARHSALRTLLLQCEGELKRQILDPQDLALPLSFVDCSQHPDPGLALQNVWRTQLQQSFDLQHALPWRVVLCNMKQQAGQKEFVVLLCMHHIGGDFISTVLFAQEFAHFYPLALQDRQQLPAALAQMTAVDDEAALQQLAAREQQALRRDASALSTRLQGVPPVNLVAHAPPLLQRSLRLGHLKIALPAALGQALRAAGANALPVCLAAFGLWLAQTGGQDRFTFGLPLDARPGKAHRNAIGFLSRPACIVFDVSVSQTLHELQQAMRSQIRQAQGQRFFPLECLQDEQGNPAVPRLNVLFNWLQANQDNNPAQAIEPLFGEFLHADMDIWFTVHESPDGFGLKLEYSQDLFAPQFFAHFARQYLTLLQTFVTAPQTGLVAILQGARNGSAQFRLALVTSFASEALQAQLQEWQISLGRRWQIHCHGYQQIMPALLQTGAGGDMLMLALRLQDVFHQAGVSSQPDQQAVLAWCDEFEAALRSSLLQKQIPHLLLCCPPAPGDAFWCSLQAQWIARLRQQQWPGLTLHSIGQDWPAGWFDQHSLQLAHLPWQLQGWRALAFAVLQHSWQHLVVAPKVLALDCDHTLWQGVIGEDGMQGIRLTPAHLALQQKLLDLQARGVLLTLVSKNNEAEALVVFEQHPQMLLRRHHLAAWRINWQDKASNILELARELNLDSEAFVLLDDNPLEIAQVSQALPQVLCLDIPHDSAALAQFVEHLWLFGLPAWQQGDAQHSPDRTLGRHQEQMREAVRADYADLAGFIEHLQVLVDVRPLDWHDAASLARASQLSLRTNQFKLQPARLSELALQTWLQQGGGQRYAKLCACRDRFGDYGITGLLLLEVQGGHLLVSDFLLSCRVLARGVELALLDYLLQFARSQHCHSLEVAFQASGRNQVGLSFLQRLCALGLSQPPPDWAGQGSVRLPSDSVCPSLHDWHAQSEPAHTARPDTALIQHSSNSTSGSSSPVVGVEARPARDADAQTLQAAWQAAQRLQQALVANKPGGAGAPGPDRPDAPLLTRLQAIWQACFPSLNPDQDFHQQGASSLAAVQALARLREEFGLQLGIGAFYQHPTLPQIAALIGQEQAQEQAQEPGARHAAASALWWQDLNLAPDWLEAGQTGPNAIQASLPEPGNPGGDNINSPASQQTNPVRHILLTGASGFIGIHLLASLLRQPELEITCLLRADDADHAAQRLQQVCRRYAMPALSGPRMQLLVADLTQPQLGLAPAVWNQLASRVDCVLHCAAQVNFFASYQQLRATNVLGTRTLLQLCAQQRSKKLVLVSSMGVLHGPQQMHLPALAETLASGTPDSLPSGYQQSKWVAEKLVARALERGVNAQIVRIGTVLAQPQTGALNHADVVVHLFAAAQEWGILPQLRSLDLLPVDFVAQALTAISLHAPHAGQVYHLTHPQPLSMQQLQTWAEWGGTALQVLPLPLWREKIAAMLAKQPDHPLALFQPLLADDGLLAMLLQAPPAVTENCRNFLLGQGLVFPPVSPLRLQQYRHIFQQHQLISADNSAQLLRQQDPGQQLHLFSCAETMHGWVQLAALPPAQAGAELDQACRQATGTASADPGKLLRFDLRCHVRDHLSLWQQQRVVLSGQVFCPQLHEVPLQVVDGWFERAPFDGYRPGAGDSLLFLQYHIHLRSQDGQAYLLRGHKLSQQFAQMFAEIAELMVCITPLRHNPQQDAPMARQAAEQAGMPGRPQALLGLVRQDFAVLFAEQLNSMQYRPGLNWQQQWLCQLSWLAFLVHGFGRNYLNLFLRRQSWSWRDSLRLWQALRTLPGLEQRVQAWRRWGNILQRLLGAQQDKDANPDKDARQ